LGPVSDLPKPLYPVERANRLAATGMFKAPLQCQDFRVRAGMMGKRDFHYVPTQRTCDTE